MIFRAILSSRAPKTARNPLPRRRDLEPWGDGTFGQIEESDGRAARSCRRPSLEDAALARRRGRRGGQATRRAALDLRVEKTWRPTRRRLCHRGKRRRRSRGFKGARLSAIATTI